MSLTAAYQTFLATANPSLLANDAALHYIPTLTTYKEPEPIVKHLATQEKVLKKKQEKVLASIESSNAISCDVETIIEFVSTGGAYLPGIDDNFIADKTVVIPILHIVNFDANGKIVQIRQHWDQGALLKNIDVIGKSGRNWPIKDGNDQAKLIVRSIEAAGKTSSHTAKPSVESVTDSLDATSIASSEPAKRAPSSSNAPSEPAKRAPSSSNASSRLDFTTESSQDAPSKIMRGSMKPAARDWEELFAGGYSADAKLDRSASPSKNIHNTTIAPKAGSNKNFVQSRIFDRDDEQPKRETLAAPTPGTPQRSSSPSKDHYITTHPDKYKHFDFYDGHEEVAPPPSVPRPKTKHQSQWDFSDFSTPAKVAQRTHAQSNPSFRIGEDGNTERPKPTRTTAGHSEQDVHFELQDDGMAPTDTRPRQPRGAVDTTGKSFFNNHTLGDNDKIEPDPNPTKNTRGVSTKDRGKDFGAHFSMTDDPNMVPVFGQGDDSRKNVTATSLKDRNKDFGAHFNMTDDPNMVPVNGQGDDSRKNVTATSLKDRSKDFSAHFTMADQSPGLGERSSAAMNRPSGSGYAQDGASKGKENLGINTAGDGMGSRKGAVKVFEENVGIATAGDGMGGKKGRDPGWEFGELDAPLRKPAAAPGRKMNTSTRSSLWDDY